MKKNSGFTLVELLVVIAIIGILSSVVLGSLNKARDKGADAKIKAQLSAARDSAEIYLNSAGNYGLSTDDCAQEMFADTDSKISTYADLAIYQGATAIVCRSTGDAYAMAVSLPSTDNTKFWCIDSTGAANQVDDAPGLGISVCNP